MLTNQNFNENLKRKKKEQIKLEDLAEYFFFLQNIVQKKKRQKIA